MDVLNSGDTAFMLVCAALVFLMTPGLAFFYGGLGRRKNMVNNLMASFFILGLGVVLWYAFGYSLAFNGDTLGFVGDFGKAFLRGVGVEDMSGSIPELAFVGFQMTFALITPALITGSVAGRMKFGALFLFIALWSLVCYYPLAHMVWGGGLLGEGWLNSVDFAGGNVVHINAGVTGLVLAIILGRRIGYEQISYRVHNVPFVMLGAGLLWFGWYGFNAGSAGAANGLAAHAFVTTSVAAAAALLSWMLIDVLKQGKPTAVGAATGIVVGLVAITPAAGFVPVWASLIIGLLVSPICYFGVLLVKKTLKIDDSLDAFGCHGIGGIWGGIATGLFANHTINDLATPGLVYGEWRQFGAQLLSIVITIVIAAVGTLICAGIVRLVTSLRVERRDELIGLDLSQHGEAAYPSFNGLD
ncbi:ammonium transporter [Planctomycetales bacterium]|nr:ammonium transporter [Planctomycetales bacterium]GHT08310.1 ammonium transporter [Planctomycetales bacterium]GHV22734.1 ammonium transporter [Planctomycetales bacterium]